MRLIFSSEDINDMYKSYKSANKTESILWCDGWKQIPGKKGHPLLQKKMKAAVKNREHLLGMQSVKQWMKWPYLPKITWEAYSHTAPIIRDFFMEERILVPVTWRIQMNSHLPNDATICCAPKRFTHTLWHWHPKQAGVWWPKSENNGITEQTVGLV